MKKISLALLALMMYHTATAQTVAGYYAIDPAHSSIQFTADHMGYTQTPGRFNQFEGGLDMTENGQGTLDVVIDVASVDTNHAKRDDHLRSPDFFNAKQFPKIYIRGPLQLTDNASLTAEIEMLGVTKPATLTLTKGKEAKDPWGLYRVGYIATTTIKRSDFGMDFMLGGIGDTITITAFIEAVKQ